MYEERTLVDKDGESPENKMARLMTYGHLKLHVNVPTVVFNNPHLKRVVEDKLPSCRLHKIKNDYTIFSILEPKNTHRYTKEWNTMQVKFAETLSLADMYLFISYSFHGDIIINQFLSYGKMLPRNEEMGPRWFMNGFRSQALYEEDMLACFKTLNYDMYEYLMRLDEREGSWELADLMCDLSDQEWADACQFIYEHFLKLFQKAPRTTEPMTLYRSEAAIPMSPPLVWYGEKRLISCTLDASVAAFHAKGDGIIYRILFPPGTPSILISGFTAISDIDEVEVLVPPIFRFKRTGKRTPIYDPGSNNVIGHYQDCVATFNPVFAATGNVIEAASNASARRPPERRNSISKKANGIGKKRS